MTASAQGRPTGLTRSQRNPSPATPNLVCRIVARNTTGKFFCERPPPPGGKEANPLGYLRDQHNTNETCFFVHFLIGELPTVSAIY